MKAPGVRLSVLPSERAREGTPLPLDGRVMSFTFEEAEDKADKVTLELENGDLALFDDDVLLGGALLEVAWGYPGWTAAPRRVVLKRLTGFRVLRVEGFALSTLLDQVVRTRRWENVTASDVVAVVAREHGYEGDRATIQPTGTRVDVIAQAAETDAHLLRRLAAKQNFEFRVDAGGLAWGPKRRDGIPARMLVWGGPEVLSLELETDLRAQAGAVEARGRDPLRKVTLARKTNAATANRTTLAEIVEVVDPETGRTTIQTRNASKAVRPSSAPSEDALGEEVEAAFTAGEARAVKLTAELVGDPDLRARQLVELGGVPAFLAGKYAIAECRHALGSGGYTTTVTLHRDGVGRRAPGAGEPQGGARNRTTPPGAGTELREHVDPETGQTRISYAAKQLCDPEATR